jgi:hypothetical protein
MGIGDKLKQGAEATRQKIEDGRQVRREAEAAAAAEAAERERETTERRHVLHATLSATCPLTMTAEQAKLPGGLTLFDDEFLVAVGKDWGWSSQKLVLTTKRVIYSRGRSLTAKDQQTVYLTDIRDVRFHKPLVGFGTLTLETAGGGSIEGLPAAKNGADVRNQLLTLIHWARAQSETAPSLAAPTPVAAAAEPSVTDTLKQLGELHAAGVLTQEEFEAKKADLLSRL